MIAKDGVWGHTVLQDADMCDVLAAGGPLQSASACGGSYTHSADLLFFSLCY
jgi:hypothetical protein